jgi:hypothetical protein
MRKGSYHASFGVRCSQNEVIGVGIDIKAKVPLADFLRFFVPFFICVGFFISFHFNNDFLHRKRRSRSGATGRRWARRGRTRRCRRAASPTASTR